ncbi:GntR family transcriptional regulator [soil metagenome]
MNTQLDSLAEVRASPAASVDAGLAPEQAIAKQLGEDIIFGRLEPGARLIEDQLIARFGVTRHCIRSALFELERSGIVVRERNKGVAVRSLTPQEVHQIYEVRELLQRQAALMIPLPAPANLVAELESINADYQRAIQARDFGAVHALNDRFHLGFFRGSGNPYLASSIQHYMALSLPVRARQHSDPKRLRASANEHAVMIELLRGTDRWALAQICVEHLQPAKLGYLQTVQARLD